MHRDDACVVGRRAQLLLVEAVVRPVHEARVVPDADLRLREQREQELGRRVAADRPDLGVEVRRQDLAVLVELEVDQLVGVVDAHVDLDADVAGPRADQRHGALLGRLARVRELELGLLAVLHPYAARADAPARLVEDAPGSRRVVVVSEHRVAREVEREPPVAARQLRVARRAVAEQRRLHERRAIDRPGQRRTDGARLDDALVHARGDVLGEIEDPVLEADRRRAIDPHAARALQALGVLHVERVARHHVEAVLLKVGRRAVTVAVERHQHALRAGDGCGAAEVRVALHHGRPVRVPVRDRVRPGADERQRRAEVLPVLGVRGPPDVLGEDVDPQRRHLDGAVLEARDDGGGVLGMPALDGLDRVGRAPLLHEVHRPDDVVRRQRLAVRPAQVGAQVVGERQPVVGCLPALGERVARVGPHGLAVEADQDVVVEGPHPVLGGELADERVERVDLGRRRDAEVARARLRVRGHCQRQHGQQARDDGWPSSHLKD